MNLTGVDRKDGRLMTASGTQAVPYRLSLWTPSGALRT